MVSDRESCNHGKDWWYIAGCQVHRGNIIPLFFKTLRKIFSYGVSQYDKNSAYLMSFNVSEVPEWVLYYLNIWNEVESQLYEKLTTETIKGEGKYMHGKLKMWRERIKTNFHGQNVSYDMYCNATAVLQFDPVHKQAKNYHRQVYVKECKYTDTESQQCNMVSNSDDEEFFEA